MIASLGFAVVAMPANAFVYWTNDSSGTIGRGNLNGTCVNQSFITGAYTPDGVAVDGQHIYWANYNDYSLGNGYVGRTNLDGTGVHNSFITGASYPAGVAVDGQHIYWTNNSGIGRANLDGTGVNQSFITGASNPAGVAVTP